MDNIAKVLIIVFFVLVGLTGIQSVYAYVDAKITQYEVITKDAVDPGSKAEIQYRFQNTGTQTHLYYLGFSVQKPDGHWIDIPYFTVSLNPNEETGVRFWWNVPTNAQTGSYLARIAVWEGESGGLLQDRLDYRDIPNAFQVGLATPEFGSFASMVIVISIIGAVIISRKFFIK